MWVPGLPRWANFPQHGRPAACHYTEERSEEARVTPRALLIGVAAVLASSCSHDCKTARDCDANQRCVSGSCKDSSASPGALGDSCAATSECGGGLTCESLGFPNGFCSAQCSTSACSAGGCAGLAAGSFCAPS